MSIFPHLLATTILLGLTVQSHALEANVVDSMDSIKSYSSKIKTIDSNSDSIKDIVEEISQCGQLGKIYSNGSCVAAPQCSSSQVLDHNGSAFYCRGVH